MRQALAENAALRQQLAQGAPQLGVQGGQVLAIPEPAGVVVVPAVVVNAQPHVGVLHVQAGGVIRGRNQGRRVRGVPVRRVQVVPLVVPLAPQL